MNYICINKFFINKVMRKNFLKYFFIIQSIFSLNAFAENKFNGKYTAEFDQRLKQTIYQNNGKTKCKGSLPITINLDVKNYQIAGEISNSKCDKYQNATFIGIIDENGNFKNIRFKHLDKDARKEDANSITGNVLGELILKSRDKRMYKNAKFTLNKFQSEEESVISKNILDKNNDLNKKKKLSRAEIEKELRAEIEKELRLSIENEFKKEAELKEKKEAELKAKKEAGLLAKKEINLNFKKNKKEKVKKKESNFFKKIAKNLSNEKSLGNKNLNINTNQNNSSNPLSNLINSSNPSSPKDNKLKIAKTSDQTKTSNKEELKTTKVKIVDKNSGKLDPFGNSINYEDPASKFNLSDLSPSGANGKCVFQNVDMENTFYKKHIDANASTTGKFTWDVLKCLSACTSYDCIKQKETWRSVYTKETGRMHYANCGTQRCEYVKSVLGYFKPKMTPKLMYMGKNDGTCTFMYLNRVKCPGHNKKYPEMINNRNGCYISKKENDESERRGWTYVVVAGPFACPSDYIKG